MTQSTETKTVIREVVRDTTIVVPPDSAWFHALLECDSAGNVLMRELESYKGRNASIGAVNLKPEPTGKAYILDVGFMIDSLRIELELRDKIIDTYKQKSEVTTKYIDKPYPWYIKTAIGLAILFICLIIAVIIMTVIKIIK